jgi:hypothetical protein
MKELHFIINYYSHKKFFFETFNQIELRNFATISQIDTANQKISGF